MKLFWLEEARIMTGGGLVCTDREILRAKTAYPGAPIVYSKHVNGREEALSVPTPVESMPEELL